MDTLKLEIKYHINFQAQVGKGEGGGAIIIIKLKKILKIMTMRLLGNLFFTWKKLNGLISLYSN